MSKLLIFFCFLFATSEVEARFSPNRTSSGRIRIQDNCTALQLRTQGLAEWTLQSEGRRCSSNISPSSEGQCVADVTDCIPRHVARYQGHTAETAGPNCWNLALVMAGILPFMRETSPEEWEHFLSSPLCRELQAGETPQAGDIGSIEVPMSEGQRNHQHGFVYAGSDLVYHKTGLAQNQPYTLMTTEQMLQVYPLAHTGECEAECGPLDVTRFIQPYNASASLPTPLPNSEALCRLNSSTMDNFLSETYQGNHGEFSSLEELLRQVRRGCQTALERRETNREACQRACSLPIIRNYRCDTMEQFMSRISQQDRAFFSSIEARLNDAECTTENALFGHAPVSAEQRQNISDTLAVLAESIVQESRRPNLTPQQRALIGIAAARTHNTMYALGQRSNHSIPESELRSLYIGSRNQLR